MTDSRYPRHQYALIDGKIVSRIIHVAEEEDPDIWKESPADLKPEAPATWDRPEEEGESPVTDVDQPSEPIGGTVISRRLAKKARKAAAKALAMGTPASEAEVVPGPDTESPVPIAKVEE